MIEDSLAPELHVYGILAEYKEPQALIAAIHLLRAIGCRELEAFTPFPVEEVYEALEMRESRLPWISFVAGAIGAVSGYLLQYATAVIIYPLNIGGRPLHSWPAFIPVTFELTILFASIATVIAMLLLNGLPRLNHPVFAASQFDRASSDRFFLCIRKSDDHYTHAVRALADTHPTDVEVIVNNIISEEET